MLEASVKAIHRIWDGDAEALPGLQVILKLLSKLYAGYMRVRASLYHQGVCPSYKLPCRVISVGNLSVGGTGKTPMVLYLAKVLKSRGLKVVVISRGYRGRFEKTGGIVSDGQRVLAGVADSGDEPQILARQLKDVPVVVGGNRYRAGQKACAVFTPDVILLDDAFQHLKLQRDLDLVLVDGGRPLGNGWTLPAGELREPAQALKRGSAVIMTRCTGDTESPAVKASRNQLRRYTPEPVFRSQHVPVVRKVISVEGFATKTISMTGRRVYAFSGVAKNDEFLYTLSGLDCDIAGNREFPDHHKYTESDISAICRQVEKLEVDVIVTTEKDYVKIKPTTRWPVDLVIMGIDISFGDDRKRFHAFIEKYLNFKTN